MNRTAGKYAVDYAKMPAAIAWLAKELLEIEATGDRAAGRSVVQSLRQDAGGAGRGDEGGVETAGGCVSPTYSFRVME